LQAGKIQCNQEIWILAREPQRQTQFAYVKLDIYYQFIQEKSYKFLVQTSHCTYEVICKMQPTYFIDKFSKTEKDTKTFNLKY